MVDIDPGKICYTVTVSVDLLKTKFDDKWVEN